MTNYENIKEKIFEPAEMFQILNIRGASKYGYEDDMPWCKYQRSSDRFYCNNHCLDDCFQAWLNKPMKVPMPEIKNGDYVFVENLNIENEKLLGVIVDNTVVFENGQWCFVKDIKENIVVVSQGPGFNVARDSNSFIWQK